MTVVVPDPQPLDLPSGNPAAVDDLVRDVSGVAFRLAEVADVLSGPAASAPGWLGADATAAEAQLVRVTAIARDASAVVRAAAGRLGAHGDLLRRTRREIDALREEQDEDHRAAWAGLRGLDDITMAMRGGAPEAVAVVEQFAATEDRRRRRHALLLEELADDAAATCRVLADAVRPVGGTGRTGDAGRVLAFLAAELPGWGDPELAARGVALADRLMRSMTPEERAALVTDELAHAGNPAFATTLVRGLGEDGVEGLLLALGYDPAGAAEDPLAGLLAAALGAAVPGDGPRDGVAAVLGATLVGRDDRDVDAIAVGMAAVLVAGARSGGPRSTTVAEWARQLLVRERSAGVPAGMVGPAGRAWGRPGEAGDPAAIAVGTLARSGDTAAAAALLGDGGIWAALLGRSWGDGGEALGKLVTVAGDDDGPAGASAVRLGLEVVGAGLVEGDPSDRTVDRATVAAVVPALGDAVAAQIEVVTGDLAAMAAGGGGERTADQMRGLGYLTVDRSAAAAVGTALTGWTLTRSRDIDGTSPSHPLPVVAVPSSYLAVQDYGQRLTHALDGYEIKEEAENRALFWDWTAGLLLEVASYAPAKPIAIGADVLGAYAPLLLGMDGAYQVGPDRGLRFDADAAAAYALAGLPPDLAARTAAVEAQAEASFRRTAATLGGPRPPDSVERDFGAATRDLVADLVTGAASDGLVDRARRGPRVGFLPGR